MRRCNARKGAPQHLLHLPPRARARARHLIRSLLRADSGRLLASSCKRTRLALSAQTGSILPPPRLVIICINVCSTMIPPPAAPGALCHCRRRGPSPGQHRGDARGKRRRWRPAQPKPARNAPFCGAGASAATAKAGATARAWHVTMWHSHGHLARAAGAEAAAPVALAGVCAHGAGPSPAPAAGQLSAPQPCGTPQGGSRCRNRGTRHRRGKKRLHRGVSPREMPPGCTPKPSRQ